MLNLTIRHYRAFTAVADLGSFTAGARLCCVTTSALSQMIKDMEAQLGFALFERRPRAVGLTRSGAAFLPHALRVLAEHNAAEQAVAGIRDGKHGLVRMPQQGRHYYEMVLRFLQRELAAEAPPATVSSASGTE